MRALIWKLIQDNVKEVILTFLILLLAVLLRKMLHIHEPAFIGLLFGLGFLAGLLMP